jgi:hypothetical protein
MPERENGFDPRSYLTGRVPLPPWLAAKKSRPFGFSGRITIADGATGIQPISIHDDAHFLVEQIQIISSAQSVSQDLATVLITDTTSSTQWSNVAVPLRDIGGLGNNPKFLLDPNILRPASTLQVQITNNIGASATFYILLMGRKIYGLQKQEVDFLTRRQWFQYVLSLPAHTSGQANVTTSLNIYNESDFILKRLMSQQLVNAIIGAAAGAESSEMLVQLRDSVSDVNLFDQQVAARLLLGFGQGETIGGSATWSLGQPFTLKKPWVLRRNGQVVATTTNLSADALAASLVTLEGIRVYDPV